jgi:hypothetical protein
MTKHKANERRKLFEKFITNSPNLPKKLFENSKILSLSSKMTDNIAQRASLGKMAECSVAEGDEQINAMVVAHFQRAKAFCRLT